MSIARRSRPLLLCTFLLGPVVTLACRAPSSAELRAEIMQRTREELAGATPQDLALIAERRGIDIGVERPTLLAYSPVPDVAAPPEVTSAASTVMEKIVKDAADEQAPPTKDFYGLNLGIAPSVLFGGPEEIESAQIVDAGGSPVVRVTESHDDSTAVLLEAHYFFQPMDLWDTYEWGIGPFFGVQVSDEDVIQGIGFGGMIGFRYNEDQSRSFNIGIGMFLDEDVQTLASGFSDGSPPPAGETQVRFEEEDAWRGVLMFSFAWGL